MITIAFGLLVVSVVASISIRHSLMSERQERNVHMIAITLALWAIFCLLLAIATK